MVKRNSSKKTKQSHKTNHTNKSTEKNTKTAGKRQPSAYLIFCAEQRTHRKTEFDTMKPKEIMQHLGAEWRKLSAQQQEAYKSKAPIKSSHDAHDKEECKSEKNQSNKCTIPQQSGAKAKSDTKHKSPSKGASKKNGHIKKTKQINEKSASRKAAQHENSHHETNISSSE